MLFKVLSFTSAKYWEVYNNEHYWCNKYERIWSSEFHRRADLPQQKGLDKKIKTIVGFVNPILKTQSVDSVFNYKPGPLKDLMQS